MLSLCLLAVAAKFLSVGLAIPTSSKTAATLCKKTEGASEEESPIYSLAEHEGFLEVGKGS